MIVLACNPSGRDVGATAADEGPTAVSAGTDETGAGEGEASGSASSSEGEGPRLDVGEPTPITAGDDGANGEGCKGIDFIFAIDNSSSMAKQQDRLVAAFPDFVATIESQLSAVDHHIMVIDSSHNPAWWCEERSDGAYCNDPNFRPPPPNPCEGYVCGSIDEQPLCEKTLGGAVVGPFGGAASNRVCDVPDGRRFLKSSDPNLADTFGCIAKVGTSGESREMPFTGITEALSPAMLGPGGCNEGFLRDDATLVITVITDDPPVHGDDAGAGDPQAWFDAVLAAKGGDINAINVIGMVNWGDVSCTTRQEETPNAIEFVQLFGSQGVLASVCEPDMGAVFQPSVDLVVDTCERFMPPG